MDASDASMTAALITSGGYQVERDLDRDGDVDASDAAQIAAGDHRAALSCGLASGLLSSYASAASPPPGH